MISGAFVILSNEEFSVAKKLISYRRFFVTQNDKKKPLNEREAFAGRLHLRLNRTPL